MACRRCSRWYPETTPPLAEASVRALAIVGDATVVPKVVEQAKTHPAATMRAASVEALGTLGDKSALPVVVELATDSDPLVRESVAATLARLGSLVEHKELLLTLRKDQAPSVRKAVVQALISLQAPDALDQLVSLLEDDSEDLRKEAERLMVAQPRSARAAHQADRRARAEGRTRCC